MEILIIDVTGCKKDVLPKKDNIENELKEEIKDEISLSIIEGTLSKDGVSIILKNNTDKEYSNGPEYSVEKEENGKWILLMSPSGYPIIWNAITYFLKANEIIEINLDFKISFGELSKVKYRITKNVFNDEGKPITDDRFKELVVEFEI